MTNQLLTQCGAERCSLEQLLTIPDPPKTRTYTPLPHYDFAVNVLTIASEILKGYRFDGDAYAVNSNGDKMFGVITYRKIHQSPDEDLKLAIGLRNSHDRSFSAGLTIGSTVLVCDNMVFSGDITVMRRHQGEDMHEDLQDQIISAIYRSQHNMSHIVEDVELMKQVPLTLEQKYQYMGMLTGKGILSPSQSSAAFKELWEPSHDEFTIDSLWSAYNCATEALKSSPVHQIVQRHSGLHQLTKTLYLN
ncbi:MAG: DUF932 domain-containing protein [Balneola sp.]|tara:strand:+ start:74693 stop:75436 length:744 start_codon:yes stop_codon:yes gene_type:complete